MGFFRRYKGRGSYDLLSNYNHFMPGFGGLGLIVALFILGNILAGFLLILLAPLGFDLSLIMLLAYPLMFVPVMLYGSAKSRRDEGFVDGYAIDNSNFGSHKWYTMALAAIILAIATAVVIEPVSMLLPEMSAEYELEFAALLGGPVWATFIMISIFAPFFEEWLCRGVVLRGMLKKVGPAWAIVISAAFFALIHGNQWQAVPAFLMGLVFGYLYYKTGSLKLTMLMHFANNTMALVISKIPSLKDAEYFSDALSPWAYGGIYALCIIAIAAGIVMLKKIPCKEGDLGGCRKIASIL